MREQINGENTAETCVYVGVLCVCARGAWSRRLTDRSAHTELKWRHYVQNDAARQRGQTRAQCFAVGRRRTRRVSAECAHVCLCMYMRLPACLCLPAHKPRMLACFGFYARVLVCQWFNTNTLFYEIVLLFEIAHSFPTFGTDEQQAAVLVMVDIWRFNKKINHHCDGYICCDVHLV